MHGREAGGKSAFGCLSCCGFVQREFRTRPKAERKGGHAVGAFWVLLGGQKYQANKISITRYFSRI